MRKKSVKTISKILNGRITKIERQKRGKKFNLYLDHAFAFSIYEDTLIKFNLKIDRELSKEETKKILEYDERTKATNSAYNLLRIRPRSKNEIKQRLSEKYSPDLVKNIVADLEKKGFLRDQDFCNFWIEAGNRKLKSKRQIQYELYQKKIDSSMIESILEKLDEEQEILKAKKILGKFQERYKDLPEKKQREKFQNLLARRGFSWEVIREVIE